MQSYYRLSLTLLLVISSVCSFGQSQILPCPPNFDFETGSFQHWTMYWGRVTTGVWQPPGVNPLFHEITTGNAVDIWGGFPKVAPGGGTYSIKIGVDYHEDLQARARYYIHVPNNPANFSFVYKLAAVLEDPGHAPLDQPMVKLVAYDSATGQLLPCFNRSYIANSNLPGFQTSPINSDVHYLPWLTESMDLSSYAGSTIVVDLETYNCYAGYHFAYAYFDVISCGTYGTTLLNCDLDNCGVTLTGPQGYQSYQWYTSNWVPVGTGHTLTCVPPPSSPDFFYVVMTPFSGPLCNDTVQTIPIADIDVEIAEDTLCFVAGTSVNVTTNYNGGIPPLSFQWTGPGLSCNNCANPTINAVAGQQYIVKITDSNNCFRSDTLEFIESKFTIDAGDNIVTCVGTPAQLNASVTPGSGNYYYSWTPNTGLSNGNALTPTFMPTVNNIGTTSYVLRVDSGVCFRMDSITITTLPNDLSIGDTTICKGSIFQVVATGHPEFIYSWVPTIGVSDPTILNPVINTDTTRVYVVTAKYPACPDIVKTITVNVEPMPMLDLGPDTFKCQWDIFPINANVQPSWYTGYMYAWSPVPGLSGTNTSHVTYSGQQNAVLKLMVSTPAGCSASDSLNLVVQPGDFAIIHPVDTAICPGDSVQLAISGGVSYHWKPVIYLSDTGKNPVTTPITDVNYTVVVEDVFGCLDTVYSFVKVRAGAVLDMPDTVYLYPGESYQMNPGGNVVYFQWWPPLGLSAPAGVNATTISNPVADPELNTRYFVRAATEAGCVVYDTIDIIRKDESLLDVPNAFSPGAPPNDILKIIRKGEATLHYFRIYNRWGNKVFETKNIDDGWDGKYNGVLQPVGVFVYVLEAVTKSGRVFHKAGNTTLIR